MMCVSILCCMCSGDSYEHDVKGANNVGMRSAYLVRPKDDAIESSAAVSLVGDMVIEDRSAADIVLSSLCPEELERKIQEFASKQQL